MRTAIELVAADPEYFKHKPDLMEYWNEVQEQGAVHMRRLKQNPLYDIARPNEPDEIKDYRDTVRRDITSEGTWSWINKISRIFIEHGITVDEASLSNELEGWVQKKPFKISGKPVDMNSFMYEMILPSMIEDPNAVLLPLPTVPNQPTVNPMGDDSPLTGADSVDVMNILVGSSKIRYLNNYIFSWSAGMWKMENGKSKEYFFIVDTEAYYRYIPVSKGGVQGASGGKKVEYELEPWYPHELDTLPINVLGGLLSKPGDMAFHEQIRDELHQPVVYYESFLRPYFELADEVVTAFSDNQGVRLQHNSPKVIMARIPCQTPGCKNGKIVDKQNQTISECPDCVGGYITNPGPYQFLIRNENKMGGPVDTRPTMEYVVPPVENLKQSYETPWDLLKRAKRTIGLDLLEDLNESGVAKAHRLEDLNDILRKVSGTFFGLVSRHLKFVESILVPSEGARQEPRINMPTDLQYKSNDILKEEAETALDSDRFQAQMDYYAKRYVNNPVIVKAHRLSLTWAPILLNGNEEIALYLSWGVYNETDLAKRDRAYIIFKTMADEMGGDKFLAEKDVNLFKKADTEIQQYIPQTTAPNPDISVLLQEN